MRRYMQGSRKTRLKTWYVRQAPQGRVFLSTKLCNLGCVLLPTKEQAAKLAESCVNTKFFRLQLEYMGTRRIWVTVCNLPANLPGEVVASYLSAFGRVEEMTQLCATAGTAFGDYTVRLYLDREGFQAIPDTLYFRDRQMMVVVEGRRHAAEIVSRLAISPKTALKSSWLGAAPWGSRDHQYHRHHQKKKPATSGRG